MRSECNLLGLLSLSRDTNVKKVIFDRLGIHFEFYKLNKQQKNNRSSLGTLPTDKDNINL